MSPGISQGWQAFRARSARAPEHELLLLLAAAEPVRTRRSGRARELLERCDGDDLLRLLVRQRLLGTLGQRLLALAPDEVAPAVREAVDDFRRQVSLRTEIQAMALERIHRAMRDADIWAVDLKGPSFALAVYGETGARPSGDLDLLVPTARLADAQAALTDLGWSDRGDLRGRDDLPLLHVASVHAHHLPTVEIHWRVHWYEATFAQEALRRSVGAGLERLQPADELLTLLLYIARDGLAGLRLVVDTISWLERFGDEPVRALPDLLRRHPQLRPAAEAALRLVSSVEGLDRRVPPPGSARQRTADRLADPLLLMPAKQTLAERSLVDILLAPRPREAVRRQLIPGRDTVRAWASHQPQPPTTREVAAHTARSLRRYALAGLRRLPIATRAPA